MGSACSRTLRSPAMIRAVTNVVLMVSDLDIIFSLLFVAEVVALEGLWKLGAIVHGAGIATYSAGVLYFGPRQKYHTVTMVQELMRRRPDEFRSDKTGTPQNVGIDSRLAPNAARGPTFGDLQPDQAGVEQCMKGLGEWGLIHLWSYCEAKNAKNTTEMEHGVPFWRLARFGFMAEPTPRDLGCILNANALYTFCTGTFQLVYGFIVMVVQAGPKIEIVLPLSISGVSFLLSVANVVLAFSEVLTAIDGERRLREQILQASENERTTQLRRAEERRDAELLAIEADFADRRSAPDLTEKSRRAKEARNVHLFAVQEIEEANLSALEAASAGYWRRFNSIKAIESGRAAAPPEAQTLGSMQEYERATAPLRAQLDRIEQHAATQTNKIDPTAMDAEKFRAAVEGVERDKAAKLETVRQQLEAIKTQFLGGAGGAAAPSSTTYGRMSA